MNSVFGGIYHLFGSMNMFISIARVLSDTISREFDFRAGKLIINKWVGDNEAPAQVYVFDMTMEENKIDSLAYLMYSAVANFIFMMNFLKWIVSGVQ